LVIQGLIWFCAFALAYFAAIIEAKMAWRVLLHEISRNSLTGSRTGMVLARDFNLAILLSLHPEAAFSLWELQKLQQQPEKTLEAR
jgi:hypothetical protein